MKVQRGLRAVYVGRRVREPLGRRSPSGDVYWREPYRRFGYVHPTPSIRVLLVGPFWFGAFGAPR